MYKITIKRKTNRITVKKSKPTIKIYGKGKRGLPGPPGPGGGDVQSVNGQTGVVVLDKTDIGLGNANDTSDADKPVSTATQAELNTKLEDITGLVTAGSGVAVTGTGTSGDPYEVATVGGGGAWEVLAEGTTVAPLGEIDTGTFTAKNFIKIILTSPIMASALQAIRFNSNSSALYTGRQGIFGAAASSQSGESFIRTATGNVAGTYNLEALVYSLSGQTASIHGNSLRHDGVGNTSHCYFSGAFQSTTPITSIQFRERLNSADYPTGTRYVILGRD